MMLQYYCDYWNTRSLDCTRWRHEAIGDEESINRDCRPCNANGCIVRVYIFRNWITWWILTVECCGWPHVLEAWSCLTQTRRQKQTLHMSVQHILLTLVLRQICNYYSSQNLKVESSGIFFFLQTTWCVAAKLLAWDRGRTGAQAFDRPRKRKEKNRRSRSFLNSISFDLLNVRERPHSNSTKMVNAPSLCFSFVRGWVRLNVGYSSFRPLRGNLMRLQPEKKVSSVCSPL